MLNSKDTGGPAFPVQSVYIEDQETNSRGMTLRDYFATTAMQAFIANAMCSEKATVFYDEVAEISYEMADAMLKAREK